MTLKNIIDGIAVTSKQSGSTDDRIIAMSKEIGSFAETMSGLINTFSDLSAESGTITTALDSLRSQSDMVKTDYNEMLSMIEKLALAMRNLAALSGRKKAG
jgi:methyl-accepting chemotaxis protein